MEICGCRLCFKENQADHTINHTIRGTDQMTDGMIQETDRRKKYILAIDQGTTSTRAIVFDHDRKMRAVAQKEGRVEYPQSGWVEQDAMEIWLDTLAVLADACNKAGIEPSQIAGIGISNQRETTVLWDRRTGLPICRAIVWQSRQSAGICARWREEGLEELVRKKTGLRIDPYFSASKIAWILENVPGARLKADRGDLLFGTMDTWLVWNLSGGQLHITDATNASRTMLCNIEKVEWDEELLEKMNIPKTILPEIVATSQVYGTTSPHAFFGEEVPICAMAGDQQAALFGQLCLERGMAKNTYGTGGFLLMNTGDQIVRSRHGLLSTIAWMIGDQVTYALEGSIFVSGSLLKWMRDKLHLFDEVSRTEQMALDAKGPSNVYIVPAFVGLGAPEWDEDARAAIFGLTLGTGRNELVRAALESLAFQVRDVIDAMQADAGMSLKVLKVDGGAAANNYLLQKQADLCGIEVDRFEINELTAMGAAFLAGLACGFYTRDDLKIHVEHRFYPLADADEVDKAYANWKMALRACRTFRPLDTDRQDA